MKSFAHVHSGGEHELMRVIFDRKPESIRALERLTGRQTSNLSPYLSTERGKSRLRARSRSIQHTYLD